MSDEIIYFYNIKDDKYYQSRYTHEYLNNLIKENQELKKQLEKLQEEYIEFQEKASDIQFELRDDRDNYYEKLQDKYREQKEFINWLKAMSKMYEEQYKDIDVAEHYNCVEKKYKEIIGGKYE